MKYFTDYLICWSSESTFLPFTGDNWFIYENQKLGLIVKKIAKQESTQSWEEGRKCGDSIWEELGETLRVDFELICS